MSLRELVLVALLAVVSAVQTNSDDICARMCSMRKQECPTPCQPCPACPSSPEIPTCPSMPEIPACPSVSEIRACPTVHCPPHPEIPACPSLPDIPACPSLPEITACPSLLEIPACPSVHCPPLPEIPVCPSVPEIPACPTPVVNLACPTCPPAPKCPDPPRATPPGYTTLPGLGTYKMYVEKRTWHDANATCSVDGGYLAIPNTPDELTHLIRMMQHYYVEYLHVGFHDIDGENEFLTVLGQPMEAIQQSFWNNGQPTGDRTRNCVFLHKERRKMSEESCSDSESFVCEISPI